MVVYILRNDVVLILVKESGQCQCTLFNYFRKLSVAIRKKNLWCDNLGAIFKTYPAECPMAEHFLSDLDEYMYVGWSN